MELKLSDLSSVMNSLEGPFYHVDDFCQIFEPLWYRQLINSGVKQKKRKKIN